MNKSLKEFIETESLEPGLRLTLTHKINGSLKTIWIGDATPYHRPIDNDAMVGWGDLKNGFYIDDYKVIQAKYFTDTE